MPKVIQLQGRVLHGKGYGKILGYPTANIDRRHYTRLPKTVRNSIRFGIYAGTVHLASGRRYRAGIVIGPKDNRGLPHLEAYLLGFHGNLYGKKIVLELRSYLRTYKQFRSEFLLKSQIQKDVINIKKLKL